MECLHFKYIYAFGMSRILIYMYTGHNTDYYSNGYRMKVIMEHSVVSEEM